jgi:hypothetical protein
MNMARMSVTVPRRHQHTLGLSDQFLWQVTEQRLNSAIGEENVAGLVNDDYGVRTCLEEIAERSLTHLLSLSALG